MYSYSSVFVGCVILTVNVPVVFMAWDFLGPEMATSEEIAIWVPKSPGFQGPPLSMARVMDLFPLNH
jgi:hypothetical protein